MDLRKDVAYAKKWMPLQVKSELQGVSQAFGGAFEDNLDEILSEVETTERFLMDTFQLLMSSINVLDSATSIQQAQSSQKLTQLAFIFIPLNLVTSIFGMNITEINDSPVPAWVCVVVLFVAVACTLGLLMVYDRWQVHRSRRVPQELWAHPARWTGAIPPEDKGQDYPANK